jgi:bifunctional DNA-binding transcriptional regulator/antitoxin component of YhaV-PrlF toxin-antitoxin module
MNRIAVDVEKPLVFNSFLVQMRARGQITLPSPLRQALSVTAGDVFTLVQVDSLLLLAPRRLMVPELADRIARLAEKRGVTVETLLQGLTEEETALFEEKYGVAAQALQPA